ncbi:MAG: type 1 glutamine amidotransferase [Ilumatobacteraceae bacterium]
MSSVVVLSHRSVAHELGHLESWFERNGFGVRQIFREDKPELPDGDLLVVLGSPNSVATGFCEQPAAAEIAMVGEWIKHDRPYLGICFGAQVLARALGGSVQRMAEKYRSYTPMILTTNSPHGLSGSWALWHEDVIMAPASSTVLAAMPHADTVFVSGSAWGVQPHIEFTPEIVARLGRAIDLSPNYWQPMYQAMKDDESGLTERAGLFLDTFWASANSPVYRE